MRADFTGDDYYLLARLLRRLAQIHPSVPVDLQPGYMYKLRGGLWLHKSVDHWSEHDGRAPGLYLGDTFLAPMEHVRVRYGPHENEEVFHARAH